MIAINWDAIGGTTLDLQTLFSADDLAKMQANAPAQKPTADRIMIWNPDNDSYTSYWLRKNPTTNEILGWANYSGNAVPASIPITKGSAFWFFRQAANDIEVALCGEVSSDQSVVFDINGANGCSGYTMIGAGFPVDLMLNEVEFAWTTGTATAPAQKPSADRIMVWNPSTDSYTTYWLRKNPTTNAIQGWANYSGNAVAADAKIPAGAAAWYYRQSATDIVATEASPLN